MNGESIPSKALDPARMTRYVPASAARVLDCACGDGALGRALKSGKQRFVAGIERDPALAEAARGALDDVLCANQYDCGLPWDDASFNCAVCDEIFPQLRDPAPLLGRVVEKLAPGGLLVVTVPNIQYYEHFLMLARGRWQHTAGTALDRRHIRFFTAFELVTLLERAGLVQIRCGILDAAAPEAFPLDDTGHVRLDDLVIGPMTAEHHKGFLAREYIALAVKPG